MVLTKNGNPNAGLKGNLDLTVVAYIYASYLGVYHCVILLGGIGRCYRKQGKLSFQQRSSIVTLSNLPETN